MCRLDIHSRWELQVFLSKKDPDFLSKWIVKEDENEDFRRFEDERDELESIQETLEIGRESALTDDPDNLELRSCVSRMQDKLRDPDQLEVQKDFLKRELEVYEKELAYRQIKRGGNFKLRVPGERIGVAGVSFEVNLSEFSKVIRGLRPARARGKRARADFVDINAYMSEVEIVAPGVSVRFDGRVMHSGYARVPYLTFEWFAKALKTFRQTSIEVYFSEGQVSVANLKFRHPDISVRLIGSRIADLPINAPLPEVLALLIRFTAEELSDSGLLAKVLAAQEEAKKLMDRAMKALAPFEIKREELSQFITDLLKKRA